MMDALLKRLPQPFPSANASAARVLCACAGVIGLVGALLAAGWLLHSWLRPAASAQQGYAQIQGGHLARLDRHAAPARVVFIGHSSFAALDTASVVSDGLNLSVGGESTAQMLTRVATYQSLGTARAVVVNTGLNDLLQHCQPIADELLRRVVSLTPESVHALVVGVQSLAAGLASHACGGEAAHLIDDHNARLEALCARRERCQFVPHPVDEAALRASPVRWHEPDGIHLSVEGSRQLRQALVTALAPVAGSAR